MNARGSKIRIYGKGKCFGGRDYDWSNRTNWPTLEMIRNEIKLEKEKEDNDKVKGGGEVFLLNDNGKTIDRIAAVAKIEGQADSIIALVAGLADYIKAHINDPAAIQAYADELSAKADAIAAAVVANPVPEP